MIEAVSPQLARSSDGYEVFIYDRHTVGYRSADAEILFPADIDSWIVLLRAESLRMTRGDARLLREPGCLTRIRSQVVDGLLALGLTAGWADS